MPLRSPPSVSSSRARVFQTARAASTSSRARAVRFSDSGGVQRTPETGASTYFS